MIYNDRPILVRAFELVPTGDFINVKLLEKALAREGYAKSDPRIIALLYEGSLG
jgi:hypothetical protein